MCPFDGAFPFESGDADPSGDCGERRRLERRRLDRRLPDPEGLRAFNVHPDLTDLPEEQPVSIEINGHPVGILLCTPENLAELAAGWIFGHGFVNRVEELRSIMPHGNRVAVMIDAPGPGGAAWQVILGGGFDTRHLAVPRIADLGLAPLPGNASTSAWSIRTDQFLERVSKAFDLMRGDRGAGGFHHATFITGTNVEPPIRDVSRHNAVDNVVGRLLLRSSACDQVILCLSGRVTADIVLKGWRAGIPVIASRVLPTLEAVELAHAAGVTLIGRVLDQRRTIYTHVWRLTPADEIE